MDIESLAVCAFQKNPRRPFCCECLANKAMITYPKDRQALELVFHSWSIQKMTKSTVCSGCGKQKETIEYLGRKTSLKP